jgi:hypothetical protein
MLVYSTFGYIIVKMDSVTLSSLPLQKPWPDSVNDADCQLGRSSQVPNCWERSQTVPQRLPLGGGMNATFLHVAACCRVSMSLYFID